MELYRIAEQNPFWNKKDAIENDKHIQAVIDSPIKIVHPIEHTIKTNEDRVYILRGPRQVGKTTLLKKSIKKLIDNKRNPSNILYFAFDIGGIKDDTEVLDLIKTYVSYARRKSNTRLWLFFDEVTYTPNWSIGLKAAYDLGLLENTTIIATGSSSLDLRKGIERLPGRRGIKAEENDIYMLPLSFRDFLKSLYPNLKIPSFDSFSTNNILEVSTELSLNAEQIKNAFDMYLLTGGYPLPMISYIQNERIESSVFYTHLQAVLGDFVKSGKKELYLREITNSIISKKSEPLSWHHIAQMTNIGSHNTISEYVEFMEAMFILKILYQSKNLGSPMIAFKKRRKLYFFDPFTFHLLNGWILGTQSPFNKALETIQKSEDKSKLVEATCGIHLMRIFTSVLFWRNRREIDFICYRERKPVVYLETKYQTTITSDDKRALKKVKGGVLLSKDNLHYDAQNNIVIVPTPYFLAGLNC